MTEQEEEKEKEKEILVSNIGLTKRRKNPYIYDYVLHLSSLKTDILKILSFISTS